LLVALKTAAGKLALDFEVYQSDAPDRDRRQLFLFQDPRTGLVTEVQILETTHDIRLDEAAVKTLRQWRFRPQTLRKFVVPIEFDLGYG